MLSFVCDSILAKVIRLETDFVPGICGRQTLILHPDMMLLRRLTFRLQPCYVGQGTPARFTLPRVCCPEVHLFALLDLAKTVITAGHTECVCSADSPRKPFK